MAFEESSLYFGELGKDDITRISRCNKIFDNSIVELEWSCWGIWIWMYVDDIIYLISDHDGIVGRLYDLTSIGGYTGIWIRISEFLGFRI